MVTPTEIELYYFDASGDPIHNFDSLKDAFSTFIQKFDQVDCIQFNDEEGHHKWVPKFKGEKWSSEYEKMFCKMNKCYDNTYDVNYGISALFLVDFTSGSMIPKYILSLDQFCEKYNSFGTS